MGWADSGDRRGNLGAERVMNHIADAVLLTALVVGGSIVIVMPRPKPEPPPVEKVEQQSVQVAVAKDRVKVEPLPPGIAEQRQVDEIAKDVREAREEVQALKDELKLQKAIEGLPQE